MLCARARELRTILPHSIHIQKHIHRHLDKTREILEKSQGRSWTLYCQRQPSHGPKMAATIHAIVNICCRSLPLWITSVVAFVFVLWLLYLCCDFCICVVAFVFGLTPLGHCSFVPNLQKVENLSIVWNIKIVLITFCQKGPQMLCAKFCADQWNLDICTQ